MTTPRICVCGHNKDDHMIGYIPGSCFWNYNCDCTRYRPRPAKKARKPKRKQVITITVQQAKAMVCIWDNGNCDDAMKCATAYARSRKSIRRQLKRLEGK